MSRAVELRDVVKTYDLGGGFKVEALRGVSLKIEKGELLSIMGPSGCGKSTLLNMIGGLDNPTSGHVIVDGIDITNMDEENLASFRLERVGFVFQSFNLVPTLTSLENVELPMILAEKLSSKDTTERATDLLKFVGLGKRLHHRPSQLSGGEKQRVAIARALANEPSIIIGDEPTGNLSSEASSKIMRFIQHLNRTLNQTFILVTHNPSIAHASQRMVYMSDGQIIQKPAPSSEKPSKEVLLKERRELILAELEWLRKSTRSLEELRTRTRPDLYNQFMMEYALRWALLKQSVRELGLKV